ncbi:MAG: sigma-54-dependent Fis family transcriptional regulator [Nitrospirae bacterium]|nr:sigma-54-dependent Fis family transcriptional regulator [Nitrospirota bacterium]
MKAAKSTVLVVDDEDSILESLKGILDDEGYEVITASSGEEAVNLTSEFSPEVILLDVWMKGMDGIETLKAIKDINRSPAVIMLSGHANIDIAIQAIRLGAYDFLEKPLSLERVLILVKRALERQRLERENIALRMGELNIIGESPKMKIIKEEVVKAAQSQGRVLIYGESGTGKEVVARALHDASDRRDKDFIEVNCAAIPHELIESELFGHEKGSFTGAFERKKGKFELADGGTLFLDEIGDMSLPTQAKVLRVIETQEFQRVGGSNKIKVDVRIITATNKNLQEEIKNGNFREDLYFRLNVILISIPPLRERKDDIPFFFFFFLKIFAQRYGQKVKKVSKAALDALMSHDWTGNVRELKNTIERFVIMNPSDIIDVKGLSFIKETETDYMSYKTLREAREQFERHFIIRKLQENKWNISKTAEELGIERSNLHKKIRALKIEIP